MLKKDIYNNCIQKNEKYIVAKCMYVLHFSLTSNTDEMLHDKIIEHAYIRLQPRERGVKNLSFCRQKANARLIIRARERGEKCAMSALFDVHAFVLGIATCCTSPKGPRNPIFMGFMAGSRFLNTFEQQ